MKKLLVRIGLLMLIAIAPLKWINAQDPITLVIKEGITKVIKAVDLKIQRMQNKTIWLQNVQKVLENRVSKAKLEEITTWIQEQKDLYQDYFDELQKVKRVIASYYRIKEITDKQVELVKEYKRAWALFKQDQHFTADELTYMEQVYAGILDESVKNLDGLFLVINSFQTQMSDAGRLEIINNVADQVETAYHDLKAFNQQNVLLSLHRAKSEREIDVIKQLYGLQ